MPLIKRSIEPVNLSRAAVPSGVKNELEFVTNSTLANVIRQISSLSKHAEDMFGELFQDANKIFRRANHLQERVDKLKVKVTQLDSTVEEVSLQDINMRKPYKSSVIQDKQVISLDTRPQAIMETYKQCDAPPALKKLNPYREDGKDSMKFYTDPMYFFELWCLEMKKDTEHQKKELKRKRQRRPKPADQPRKTPREIKSREQKYRNLKDGVELAPEAPKPARPNSIEIEQQKFPLQDHYGQANGVQQRTQDPGQMAQHTNGTQHIANGPYMGNQMPSQTPPTYRQPPAYYGETNSSGQQIISNQPQQTPTNYQAGMGYGAADGSPQRRGSKLSTPGSAGRPMQPPPLPPGGPPGVYSPLNRAASTSRDSLPPPPPPPPLGTQDQARNTPPYGSPGHFNHIMNRGSPGRSLDSHSPSPQMDTPDRSDLPPPPPPPPVDNLGSMDSMLPPPPTPPMMSDGPSDGGIAPPPPPPPPPPPVGMNLKPPAGPGGQMPNGDIHNSANVLGGADAVSITSDVSSNTVSSASTLKSDEANKAGLPPVRDERSDLLLAIRTGIQLRKVEERREREEHKKQPMGGLDVQSIMEAAFEMRRKALEANDSDDEEIDDNAWESDED